jgi:hypothetical protein
MGVERGRAWGRALVFEDVAQAVVRVVASGGGIALLKGLLAQVGQLKTLGRFARRVLSLEHGGQPPGQGQQSVALAHHLCGVLEAEG